MVRSISPGPGKSANTIPARCLKSLPRRSYVRTLVPSYAIVQMPSAQLTRGKSFQLFQPGVVRPVASRGADVPGLEWPLATKYGNEPPDPLRKLINFLFASPLLADSSCVFTARHLSYRSALLLRLY